MSALLRAGLARCEGFTPYRRTGRVRRLQGLAIESAGPPAGMGELCRIFPSGAARRLNDPGDPGGPGVLAEVVGVAPDHLTLMAYGSSQGIAAGAPVVALGSRGSVPVGPALLGRVIDAFGQALDGRPAPATAQRRTLYADAPNPLQRPRIDRILPTGVRAIDALLTLGQGQRMGIFAGSGVGKSTLLGMIAQHVQADVNVIALIGERGREVREFIERHLGAQGLARSVVVVATSDQPAPARARAAHAAVAIAGDFAQAGRSVLLTMDSVTRLAMARREIGLAAGEPPTSRGYTPSVFAELPPLCERCGTWPSGGSVTALLTVLVEGDDLHEPIADSLRSLLDGHIVLSRELAQQGHYPAIDVVRSASRLLPDLASSAERAQATLAVQQLALLARHQPMVDIGAYTPGSQPALDAALALQAPLQAWLRQASGGVPRAQALAQLQQVLGARDTPPGGAA